MAQWLRALTALAEDLGLVPAFPGGSLMPVISVPGYPTPFLTSAGFCMHVGTCMYMQAYLYSHGLYKDNIKATLK